MTQPLNYAHTPLRREIGLGGAVMLGLGAILGSGVFVGLPQATAIAGPWILISILLAGGLAFCNAMSSAQLAAAHPVSGGTYEYGYRFLSPVWGFVAGWSFLLAKSASAATAVLGVVEAATVLAHASGVNLDRWLLSKPMDLAVLGARPSIVKPELTALAASVAALVILAVVLATLLSGLRRTNALNSVIVSITLTGLVLFMSDWLMPPTLTNFRWLAETLGREFGTNRLDLYAVVNATALVFVAFAGYARLATLGEEVWNPKRTIPIAILSTLAVALMMYLLIGALISYHHDRLRSVGVDDLQGWNLAQIAQYAAIAGGGWQRSVRWSVLIAAITAMLGVLLNLILGLSRVWLAMGRRGDMPAILAQVNVRTGTPVPATLLTGLLIALLVLIGRDVKTTWSFSAFSVLIYYAITNLACLRLPAEARRFPRVLAWIGLFACLSLAWFVEVRVWVAGLVLIGLGLLWHLWRRGRVIAVG